MWEEQGGIFQGDRPAYGKSLQQKGAPANAWVESEDGRQRGRGGVEQIMKDRGDHKQNLGSQGKNY